MPRPGPWMVNFKQAMGFVLFGTACWLMYVLGSQLDYAGVVWTLTFFCFLGFALWIIGKIGFGWSTTAKFSAWATALVVVACGAYLSFYYMYDLRAALDPTRAASSRRSVESHDIDAIVAAVKASDWTKIPWQHYAPGLANELAMRGYTVYVDYTATWCVSCQANKVSSLEIPSTREKMKELGVIPVEADYSKPNAEMLKDLLAFRHNSVPLNLVYPAGAPDKVEALPVLLTPSIVQDALTRAGPSKPGGGLARNSP
jgi:thiol:disulfide interchange protein DsbD